MHLRIYAFARLRGSLILTFASSKGGVGKSTSCVALAGAYVKAGARVHIIDLDNNGTVSRWLADNNTRPKNLTVSVPDPQILTEHLQEAARHYAPDKILIDVAGNYERALTVAIARAHLTLIPASTTEADIFEAARIARHIQTIYAAFGKTPLYRMLATRVAPLATHAQAHGFKEIARLKLPLLNTTIAQRAAYEEIGLSGLPPHFADPSRPTTAKAIAELDLLKDEIEALLDETYGEASVSSSTPAAEFAT
jgi:chromosome partitioning protein